MAKRGEGDGSSGNAPQKASRDGATASLSRRHLSFGWWSLLLFLTGGLVLEAFHGFKVEMYLNVANETRRLMWTLAHAHGTLLSLINIAFGLTLSIRTSPMPQEILASRALLAASILLPAGFFLGGIVIYAGDPGLGVLLVPFAGALLFTSVFLIARGVGRK
ncbi:MAG: hypothetical protein R3E12_10795 [Candidatus Eisenbacteria bacterium]|uniref:Uncharacterized protein n=1 Tax=Eiseniibacteriota bacterium TaxID=2212470 RepID=A0A956M2E6_UNCEI|nr:hypothetical protein [Candidatus Eisenbacteria bacterium]